MNNNVNHPSHYNKSGRKECILEMREKYGVFFTSVFCLLNTYKYLYRAGEKECNSKEQDLGKALWYYNWVVNNAKGFSGKMILKTRLFKDAKRMIVGGALS